MTVVQGADEAWSGLLARRKGTPGLVADLLRTRITNGELHPGTKLPVDKISASIGVSANAVREALQLLERERLVRQILNRGIFVSELSARDVSDVYRMRRYLELGVLTGITSVPEEALAALRAAVELGDESIAAEDWQAAGNATTEFHRALVSMAQSERVTVTMQQLLAELRLIMSPLDDDHHDLHRSYLAKHRDILTALENGAIDDARHQLEDYLNGAETALLALFED